MFFAFIDIILLSHSRFSPYWRYFAFEFRVFRLYWHYYAFFLCYYAFVLRYSFFHLALLRLWLLRYNAPICVITPLNFEFFSFHSRFYAIHCVLCLHWRYYAFEFCVITPLFALKHLQFGVITPLLRFNAFHFIPLVNIFSWSGTTRLSYINFVFVFVLTYMWWSVWKVILLAKTCSMVLLTTLH